MALTDSLVSYWKLDEASGSRADSHGSNTLADVNTVGSTTGKINNGAIFAAASSERLEDTSFSLTDNETISVSFWAKGTGTFGSSGGVFGMAPASAGTRNDIVCRLGSGITTIGVRWVNGSEYSIENNFTTASNNDDTWHHYVVRIYNSGGFGTTDIYFDGTFAGTASHGTQAFAFLSWTKMYVGTHVNNFASSFVYLTGSLDEFAIWDRTITTTEITQLYNGGAGLAYPLTVATVNTGFFNFM